MRDRTSRRAMERLRAKAERKSERAIVAKRREYDDPAYLESLDLPADMPDEAKAILAESEARKATRYRPNRRKLRKYGLEDLPGFGAPVHVRNGEVVGRSGLLIHNDPPPAPSRRERLRGLLRRLA